ncbi:MAG: hypothetical protein MHM6MM_001886 [Cercozoa sp. M6MM]
MSRPEDDAAKLHVVRTTEKTIEDATPYEVVESEDGVARRADGVSELQTMCMACGGQGTTRMLLTTVPFFRDVVLMSFRCPNCGHRATEVDNTSGLAEKGVQHTVVVKAEGDLNRAVVKSTYASIRIPEIDFEIPSQTQKGQISTVEGFIMKAADDLESGQSWRRQQNEVVADHVQRVIDRLRCMLALQEQWTFVLNDPSGNSFVENPHAPLSDPNGQVKYFARSRAQLKEMGYLADDAADEEEPKAGTRLPETSQAVAAAKVEKSVMKAVESMMQSTEQQEVLRMSSPCYACPNEADTLMCFVNIPNFKDLIIMNTQCSHCGARDVEVKPSGAISRNARRITLRVESVEDLSRDVLKSDSSAVLIPELELELVYGTLGGKYTTVEGLLDAIREQLAGATFAMGDSATSDKAIRFNEFMAKFDKLASCEEPWHLVINDPLSNSFVRNPHAPAADPQLTIEDYPRTAEQNEEFGLTDMRTEHYGQDGQESRPDIETEAMAELTQPDAEWQPRHLDDTAKMHGRFIKEDDEQQQ